MRSLLQTKFNNSLLHIWLFFFRVGASALMLTHGLPKLEKLIQGNFKFADPIGIGAFPSLLLATFAEFFCSVLIILGLGTRLASIPIIITMGVAAFIVHANDPFSKQEFPMLYLLVYITILVLGGGKYSLDRLISKK
jgi:putative oxidoreductase